MKNENGFSLIETIVALGILATGLLGMAALFTLGLTNMATSSANLVAREKAREAVESVHTARDTRTIVWCQIFNKDAPTRPPGCSNAASDNGVFLTEPQPMYKAGVDGLVGTADDATSGYETASDGSKLTNYTRQIIIETLKDEDGSVMPNLRKIVVKIDYHVGQIYRTYTLTTYISSIS